MNRALTLLASLSLGATTASAADLKPDATTDIPAIAQRPTVVRFPPSELRTLNSGSPKADLPAGYELQTIAAPPLVTHPIMGCLDDRGRLFVGDATGVNWNKKQLEENPPNRVLMLEDTDGDGIYDKSTVFADKMTFPQGGCWLNGSLYVGSPPGIWKLTDTDGDGVADQREMIVSGFEYTGNAADIHGPWLHPNGRLYWCHGRKGHKATDRDGKVIHEGLACGIWSCKPDGRDLQWHALGCGDNPVKVDFTPEGEVIGVQNLYYTNPRGDTLVHWLYGGVYERSDQLKAIEGLPRTLEHMPVMHNFGHVAVSGCCFWNDFPTKTQEPRTLNFMVTHFNTQRVVRMELRPDGATYKATENEFLRLHDPDIHFTDVLEAKDGSLIVLNTGGWFRIGCPSSLMAKPDVLGAVYRVRKKDAPLAKRDAGGWQAKAMNQNDSTIAEQLRSENPVLVRKACDSIVSRGRSGEKFSGDLANQWIGTQAFSKWIKNDPDPALEHSLILANAWIARNWDGTGKLLAGGMNIDSSTVGGDLKALDRLMSRQLLSRGTQDTLTAGDLESGLKRMEEGGQAVDAPKVMIEALKNGAVAYAVPLEKPYKEHELSDAAALFGLRRLKSGLVHLKPEIDRWLGQERPTPPLVSAMTTVLDGHLDDDLAKQTIGRMLAHGSPNVRKAALTLIAGPNSVSAEDSWLPPLEKALAEAKAGDLPLLLDAIKKLKTNRFDNTLQAIAGDTKQPLPLRLRALSAVKGLKLTPETFALLQSVLTSADSSAAARIQAASMLAAAPLQDQDIAALAPLFASVGPIEFKELLAILRKIKDAALLRTVSLEIAQSPVIASQQESIYRTALADKPTDIFESIILPAYLKATEAAEEKKRQLGPLAEKAAAQGDAQNGRAIYESGKGTCIACHQIGDKGRSIGPNLSHIGAIRTERDLLESILFPSNTLARDYEAHVIETSDGQSTLGVIKSHTAEGLLVVDAAGQEKNIPHARIVGDTQLPTSLMPMGLDQTLPEKELRDLVAYLRSLK